MKSQEFNDRLREGGIHPDENPKTLTCTLRKLFFPQTDDERILRSLLCPQVFPTNSPFNDNFAQHGSPIATVRTLISSVSALKGNNHEDQPCYREGIPEKLLNQLYAEGMEAVKPIIEKPLQGDCPPPTEEDLKKFLTALPENVYQNLQKGEAWLLFTPLGRGEEMRKRLFGFAVNWSVHPEHNKSYMGILVQRSMLAGLDEVSTLVGLSPWGHYAAIPTWGITCIPKPRPMPDHSGVAVIQKRFLAESITNPQSAWVCLNRIMREIYSNNEIIDARVPMYVELKTDCRLILTRKTLFHYEQYCHDRSGRCSSSSTMINKCEDDHVPLTLILERRPLNSSDLEEVTQLQSKIDELRNSPIVHQLGSVDTPEGEISVVKPVDPRVKAIIDDMQSVQFTRAIQRLEALKAQHRGFFSACFVKSEKPLTTPEAENPVHAMVIERFGWTSPRAELKASRSSIPRIRESFRGKLLYFLHTHLPSPERLDTSLSRRLLSGSYGAEWDRVEPNNLATQIVGQISEGKLGASRLHVSNGLGATARSFKARPAFNISLRQAFLLGGSS
ncbi:hypothetical protein IPG41_00200 [Candidatus Peregrinibacteria bacterium]|nr:MAG: hypothetical protein IPG41_00200 [Candidatus Peregrinibacteria bacterium]